MALNGEGEMFTEARATPETTKKQIMMELQGTDMAMARVVEEIATKLMEKNIIQAEDLSMYAQEILSRRKILRQRYRSD